jgi:hypothetical protein
MAHTLTTPAGVEGQEGRRTSCIRPKPFAGRAALAEGLTGNLDGRVPVSGRDYTHRLHDGYTLKVKAVGVLDYKVDVTGPDGEAIAKDATVKKGKYHEFSDPANVWIVGVCISNAGKEISEGYYTA